MIIITSGDKYTELDSLSSAIGLKEFWDLQGIDSKVVLPGDPNETISRSIRKLGYVYENSLSNMHKDCQFIIVDVSDPKYFASFVQEENVIEIYDHHFGFEGYWKARLGKKSKIESVGCCTTLIWEKYKESELSSRISTLVANLFCATTAIHTLNFNSSVTTQRDIKAYKELKQYTDSPSDFIEKYFREVESAMLKNPEESIRNDTKIKMVGSHTFRIMQVELWNSKRFISENIDLIMHLLNEEPVKKIDFSFFTSPSISEGKNYILVKDRSTREILEEILPVEFKGNLGKTGKLYLRKEIIKKLQSQFSQATCYISKS
ncbi:hypothetical protein GF357_04035 [Candidatus Dojkabacteria bacterium]|nr:hypothetical protein [Candidatus Dojkabacteria bacterium]